MQYSPAGSYGIHRNFDLDESKKYFIRAIQLFYNVTDKRDIVLQEFKFGKTRHDLSYLFYIKRYVWSDYEYEFVTHLPDISLIHRQTIYDRPKWGQLIKSIIDPNKLLRTIELKEKWSNDTNPTTYKIKEIIISSLFGDHVYLNIGGNTFKVNLFQREDESISTQTIVFF